MRTMKHLALATASVAALALAACGGGGGGTASGPGPKMVAMPTVPADHAPTAGTYQIAANGTVDVDGVRFSCADSPCVVTVNADGTADYRGGDVTADQTPVLMALLASQAAAAAQVAAAEAAQAAAEARATSAEADKAAAEAAQATAEARATAAEADKAAAEAAQATAEADAEAALTAQAAAEAAQATAEARATAAEAAQAAAEAAQATAEAAQAAAEAARKAAEEDTQEARDAAAAAAEAQAAAEANEAAAQAAKAEADVARAAAEAAQAAAEENEAEAEAAQAAAEEAKTAAEAAQAAAEEAKATAEANEAAAQKAKAEAEAAKATAEANEAAAEAAKAEAEAELAKLQEAEEANRLARAAAAKLYAGISAPTADDTDTADTTTATGTRFAQYVTTANNPAGASVGDIEVAISNDADVALSEDKDTTVAALRDWTGKRYHRTTSSATQGTYEAYVYSHIGEPTQGKKFGQVGVTTPGSGYQYGLNANGVLTGTDVETTADKVDSSRFDHSAGVKSFDKAESLSYLPISGTYHGVSGEYRCTPGTGNKCAAQVASEGFNLGGLTDDDNDPATPDVFSAGNAVWIFKPTTPGDQVTSTPDGSYASYGWWQHTKANGDVVASAFVARRGTPEAASGLNALNGKATYMGGAAGTYALTSTTGGTNDSGDFTAKATLEANFTTNTDSDSTSNAITGTIDNFIGADGESRDWKVELKGSPISNIGVIGDSTGGTAWTIGGAAADDSGSWVGSLQENGDDGVPAIATGTFYTTYGTSGKMVGAFGANKQ